MTEAFVFDKHYNNQHFASDIDASERNHSNNKKKEDESWTF
jgi:hypothetical protein